MRTSFNLFFLFCICLELNGQLASGDHAPNFNVTDIEGNQHQLYDILDAGYTPILEFSATWCIPCWDYHEEEILKDFYATHGPAGTDKARVYFIETDPDTGLDDLTGDTDETLGDWISLIDYPVIDDSNAQYIFQINSVPKIWMICADGVIHDVRTSSVDELESLMNECQALDQTKPTSSFFASSVSSQVDTEINFYSESWPPADSYLWDFGDGKTSTLPNPTHSYEEGKIFTVTLVTSNEVGSDTFSRENYIFIEGVCIIDGFEFVGETDSLANSFVYGSGRHGMIFDVHFPLVLASVKVYATTTQERTFAIFDDEGKKIIDKSFFLEEGEQRAQLNFFLPPGENYTLRLISDSYLVRSNGELNFPYELPYLISIHSSTFPNSDWWINFFDWEINGLTCLIGNNEKLDPTQLQLLGNPVSDYLELKVDQVGLAYVIYNHAGFSRLKGKTSLGTTTIDIHELSSGIHWLVIDNQSAISFMVK